MTEFRSILLTMFIVGGGVFLTVMAWLFIFKLAEVMFG